MCVFLNPFFEIFYRNKILQLLFSISRLKTIMIMSLRDEVIVFNQIEYKSMKKSSEKWYSESGVIKQSFAVMKRQFA